MHPEQAQRVLVSGLALEDPADGLFGHLEIALLHRQASQGHGRHGQVVDRQLGLEFRSGRRVPLLPEGVELVLGRCPPSDVLVDDPAASAMHCRLAVAGGHVRVEDLGSRNGTLLNGERLRTPAIVATGQGIGGTTSGALNPSPVTR